MAETLEPIVLNLTDRGACAVDYIDLFDEGMYGPDKPFFIGRFKNLDDVAAQMNKCLELQSIEGSLIHYRRLHQDHVFREFPADINDPYPNKARNAIRFMLRIKFYGDFGYLDIGKKWEPLYKNGKLNENYPLSLEREKIIYEVSDDGSETEITVKENKAISSEDEIQVYAEDLSVINRCWLSQQDANDILSYILDSSLITYKKPVVEASELQLAYITDDSGIPLTDGNGLPLLI